MSALFFIVFCSATICLAAHRRHLLFSILALEGVTLSSFAPFVFELSSASSSLTFMLVLVFVVAEATLGLGVLVNISRNTSNHIAMG